MNPPAADVLDRSSFVPLYYQLQEALKQHIESGGWGVGDALPSEPTLARHFGVSRVVVRQALAILEDDRQIVRIRGRGTFVAAAKQDTPVCGLAGLLAMSGTGPRRGAVSILVLDVSRLTVERSIRDRLDATASESILRVTTVVHVDAVPMAICYSFFRRQELAALEDRLVPGELVAPELTLADLDVTLARTEVAIEVSQCGRFEADRFDVAHRAPVFLVSCVHHREAPGGTRPFEVARIEYRGDLVSLRLDSQDPGGEKRFVAAVRPGRP